MSKVSSEERTFDVQLSTFDSWSVGLTKWLKYAKDTVLLAKKEKKVTKKHKVRWSLKNKYPDRLSDQEASLVLKDLIQSHPHEVMREDLDRLITGGSVFLNFQDSVTSGQNALATVMYVNTPTHGTVLALNVSKRHLTDPHSAKLFKQLVIYHEWHHLRQQIEGTEPRWLATGIKNPGQMSDGNVRIFFESEMKAYLPECELALKLDAVQLFPLYGAFAQGGVSGLRIQLAESYARIPVYSVYADLLRSIAVTAPA